MEFKIGDKVRRKSAHAGLGWDWSRLCNERDLNHFKSFEIKCRGGSKIGFVNDPCQVECHKWSAAYFELVSETSENKMDIEKLKTFDPKNLVTGKQESVDEKATYELNEAKKAYTELTNDKEEQQRIIKNAQTKIKELDKRLSIFKK